MFFVLLTAATRRIRGRTVLRWGAGAPPLGWMPVRLLDVVVEAVHWPPAGLAVSLVQAGGLFRGSGGF